MEERIKSSLFAEATELSTLRLEYGLRPETLKKIEELGKTNPKLQDILFQNWAKEISAAAEDRPPVRSDKLELQAKLAEAAPVIIDEIAKAIDLKLKNKDPKDFSERFGNLFIRVITPLPKTLGFINFYMRFESPKAEVEYKWMVTEGTIVNMHRLVSENLRGYGIGSYMETVTRAAAHKLKLSKIYFETGNSNPGMTFGLSREYICETLQDRQRVQEILLKMHTDKREYTTRRKIPEGESTVRLVKNLL